MTASPKMVDFTDVVAPLDKEIIMNGDGRPLSAKQARARIRRRIAQGKELDELEPELRMMMKPVEEWDLEELARGRPRAKDGTFRGLTPKWITKEVHEEAMARFKKIVKTEMNQLSVKGLSTIDLLLENNDEDDRGRAVVPPSTKLDASKFLLEHVVGKPTQPVKQDISVRLQAILGHVMVNPSDSPGMQELPTGGYAPAGYSPAHYGQLGAAVDPDEEVYEGEIVDE